MYIHTLPNDAYLSTTAATMTFIVNSDHGKIQGDRDLYDTAPLAPLTCEPHVHSLLLTFTTTK